MKILKISQKQGVFLDNFYAGLLHVAYQSILNLPPPPFQIIIRYIVMPYTAKYMIIEWILDQIWEQGVLHRNHPPDPPFKTTVQENPKLEFWIGPFLKVVRWPWFSFLNYLKNKPFFARFKSYGDFGF